MDNTKADSVFDTENMEQEVMNGITKLCLTVPLRKRNFPKMSPKLDSVCKLNLLSSRSHPADSVWSWVTLACACIGNMVIAGTSYCFGVIYPSLLDHFGEDKANTALVGSLSFVTAGVVAPITGKLADRVGCRTVAVTSALLCAVAFFASAFASNIYIMFVTFSLPVGFATSCQFCAVYLAVPTHFNKYCSFAVGVLSAGISAGVFVMSPILQSLLDWGGYKNAFLTIAAVLLLFCAFAWNVTVRTEANVTKPRTELVLKKTKGWSMEGKEDLVNGSCWIRLTDLLHSLFLNLTYTTYSLGSSTFFIGATVLSVHMAEYSRELGIAADQASQLYMYFGLMSLFARVITGRLLDMNCLRPLYIYQLSIAASGIITLLLPLETSFVYLATLYAALGYLEGSVATCSYVGLTQVISYSVPWTKQGQAFAFHLLLFHLFYSTGGPLAGWIVDQFGSYAIVFYVAGSIEIATASLVFLLSRTKPKPRETEQTINTFVDDAELLMIVERVSVL